MKSAFISNSILSLSLLLLSIPCLQAETKIPSTEKSLKSFIDKEIALYSNADNTEYTDRLKLAQRVWISFYKAEVEFATQVQGLPIQVNNPLKGSALEKNVNLMKRALIQSRYHDFIYKPALVSGLPKTATYYANPLLQQMEDIMEQHVKAKSDAGAEASSDDKVSAEPALFDEQFLLASQYQFFLSQLDYNNAIVTEWLNMKYRFQPNFKEIIKAKEEADKKWLAYLEAVQHVYTKQDDKRAQINAYNIGIALLLRRLETVQKQLPFEEPQED